MKEPRTTALGDLLDDFSSSDPAPGGGSAAALTGSLGVSLLLMVSGMAKTRTGSPEETTDLAAAAARLRPLREELAELIEDDSNAYRAVIAAYKLPKDTEAARAARQDAIEQAMRGATTTPLRTMRVCDQALREAPLIVRVGNPNAVIDAAVGARLLRAALEGAALNVVTNLPGIKDDAFRRVTAEERQALLASAATVIEQIDAAVAL